MNETPRTFEAKVVSERLNQELAAAMEQVKAEYPGAHVGFEVSAQGADAPTRIEGLSYLASIGKIPWVVGFLRHLAAKGIDINAPLIPLVASEDVWDNGVIEDVVDSYFEGKFRSEIGQSMPGSAIIINAIRTATEETLDELGQDPATFEQLTEKDITAEIRAGIMARLPELLAGQDLGVLSAADLVKLTLGPSANFSLILIKMALAQQGITSPAEYAQAMTDDLLSSMDETDPQIFIRGSQRASEAGANNSGSLHQLGEIFELCLDDPQGKLGLTPEAQGLMREAMRNRMADPDTELAGMVDYSIDGVDVFEKSGSFYDATLTYYPGLAAQSGWQVEGNSSAHFCTTARVQVGDQYIDVRYTVSIPHSSDVGETELERVNYGLAIKEHIARNIIRPAIMRALPSDIIRGN